ncbi:hypothetical protein ACFFX0_19100 [Citricoccus parietis]|uniref:Uncharacterized protein n=1 Tax=Citricoccus parietis TaxID=592307 RepID=A0ABV5G2P0_9MICC
MQLRPEGLGCRGNIGVVVVDRRHDCDSLPIPVTLKILFPCPRTLLHCPGVRAQGATRRSPPRLTSTL